MVKFFSIGYDWGSTGGQAAKVEREGSVPPRNRFVRPTIDWGDNGDGSLVQSVDPSVYFPRYAPGTRVVLAKGLEETACQNKKEWRRKVAQAGKQKRR